MSIHHLGRLGTVNEAIRNLSIPGVTIVRDSASAARALECLYKYKDRVHAWDTETVGVDIKKESPVGRGYVICASAFIGPEVNFGNGPSNV